VGDGTTEEGPKMSNTRGGATWLLAVVVVCLPILRVGITAEADLQIGWGRTEILFRANPEQHDPVLNQLYAAFRQSHPNVNVQSMPARLIDTPISAYIEQREVLPEMIIAYGGSWEYDDIPYLVDQGLIIPLDEYLNDTEYNKDDFINAAWEPATYRGKIWGAPLATDSMALCCHMDVFARAGLKDPPKTWDELVEVAKKTTLDLDGDGEIDQYGLHWDPFNVNHPLCLWHTIALQKGARFSKEGRWDFSDPKLAEAFQFLLDLRNKHGVATDDKYAKPHAMCIKWRYHKPAENERLVLLPVFEHAAYSIGECAYITLTRTTREKQDACWEFIKWLTQTKVYAQQAIARGSLIPLRESMLDYKPWRDFVENENPAMKLFTESVRSSRAAPVISREGLTGLGVLKKHLRAAYENKESVAKALADAEDELNSILKNVKVAKPRYQLYE